MPGAGKSTVLAELTRYGVCVRDRLREADRGMSTAPPVARVGTKRAIAHPLPDDLVGLSVDPFQALAEPTRIKLHRLREGEATASN
jgi:hypothetical protein